VRYFPPVALRQEVHGALSWNALRALPATGLSTSATLQLYFSVVSAPFYIASRPHRLSTESPSARPIPDPRRSRDPQLRRPPRRSTTHRRGGTRTLPPATPAVPRDVPRGKATRQADPFRATRAASAVRFVITPFYHLASLPFFEVNGGVSYACSPKWRVVAADPLAATGCSPPSTLLQNLVVRADRRKVSLWEVGGQIVRLIRSATRLTTRAAAVGADVLYLGRKKPHANARRGEGARGSGTGLADRRVRRVLSRKRRTQVSPS
jgi:hypothetical protein